MDEMSKPVEFDKTKNIQVVVKFPRVEDWLRTIEKQEYIDHFYAAGYEHYKYNMLMMMSEHFMINDMVLKNDFKISDGRDRHPILLQLYKGTHTYTYKFLCIVN